MRRQDMWSILITFTVGFFAGGYLYVTHFSKLVSPDDVQTEEETEAFSIVGEAYGSCNDVCPSFQVLQNGAYRYQFTPEIGAEKIIKDGTLPYNILREVKQSLDVEVLTEQSQVTTPQDCNSRNNGIDVRYTITYNGAEYGLDSCGTQVDGEGALWGGLAKVWNHFETVK